MTTATAQTVVVSGGDPFASLEADYGIGEVSVLYDREQQTLARMAIAATSSSPSSKCFRRTLSRRLTPTQECRLSKKHRALTFRRPGTHDQVRRWTGIEARCEGQAEVASRDTDGNGPFGLVIPRSSRPSRLGRPWH